MSQFWRASAVTSAGLLLETCAFSLAISVAVAAINLSDAGLPIWLVFCALLTAYFLSMWIQALPFTRGIRGGIGLLGSLLFLAIFSSSIPGPDRVRGTS